MRRVRWFVLLYLLAVSIRCGGGGYLYAGSEDRTYTTRVSGRVTTPEGGGVGGVTVSVYGTVPAGTDGCGSGGSWSGEAVTASDGSYSVAATSTVAGGGSVTVTPHQTAEYDFSPSSRSLSVTIGRAHGGIDFTAVRVRAVSGTVRDGAGDPLPGTTITLQGPAYLSAYAGDNGWYLFPRVVEGEATLTPSLASHSFDPPLLRVTVAGEDSTGNDFTGSYIPHRITGRATLFGNPFPGVSVTAAGAGSASAVTDAAGRYDLGTLPRGAYEVTAEKTGYLSQTRNADLQHSDVSVDFAMVPASNVVSGRVTMDGTGAPVPDVAIRTQLGTGTSTNGSGEYFLPLQTGSYTLTPSTSCPTYAFFPTDRSVSILGADVAGQDFTARYASSPSGFIRGTVTSSSGAGLAGISVSAWGPDNVSAKTGFDGTFSFTWLHNGTYAFGPTEGGYRFTPARVEGVALCNGGTAGHVFREIDGWSRYGYLSGAGEGEIRAIRPLSSGFAVAGAGGRVARLGPYGEFRWGIALGGSGDEFSAVAEGTDDSLAAAGTGIGADTGRREAIVARVAGDGAVRWIRRLVSGGHLSARAAALLPDNGVLVAGTADSDLFLARLDGDGTLLWQKSYGGYVPVALRVDGSVATAAAAEGTAGRMLVLRTDLDGAVLSARGYRKGSGVVLAATTASVAADGAVVFGGRYGWPDYPGAGTGGATKDCLWAMAVAADGAVSWQGAAGLSPYTGEEASAVLPGEGGSAILLGRQRASGFETAVLLRFTATGAIGEALGYAEGWPLRRVVHAGLALPGGRVVMAGDRTDFAYYGAWVASFRPGAGACGPGATLWTTTAATSVVRDDPAVTAADGPVLAATVAPAPSPAGSAPQTDCAY